MKILVSHNHYQWFGGEDQIYIDETSLLEAHGHEVVRYTLHNDAIDEMSNWEMLRKTFWNNQTYHKIRSLIQKERPAIIHSHNTFPLISPSLYYAARAEKIPIVQTLQNYRQFCLNGFFTRKGKVCEDCLGKTFAWPGVLRGCYRQNRAASTVAASMIGFHRSINTWSQMVSKYISPSKFTMEKYFQAGFSRDKIVYKPNFIHPEPSVGKGNGNYVVYVGRLSKEKGIDTLLSAWSQLRMPVTLKIVGDGVLADSVRKAASRDNRIEWLGSQPQSSVYSLVGDAACLAMPSIWYEVCPKTILEAFAKGTPVITSRLGGMAEFVQDGHTGLLFERGNASDLAAKVDQFFSNPLKIEQMRKVAREEYEREYTAETNYKILIDIYNEVLGKREIHHNQLNEPIRKAS